MAIRGGCLESRPVHHYSDQGAGYVSNEILVYEISRLAGLCDLPDISGQLIKPHSFSRSLLD